MIDVMTEFSQDLQELLRELKRQNLYARIEQITEGSYGEAMLDEYGEEIVLHPCDLVIKCRLHYGPYPNEDAPKKRKRVDKKHIDAFEAGRVVLPNE